MSEFIPLSVPNFGAREAELAGQAITSGWVSTSGGKVTEFEEALAAYVGMPRAVACNAGTSALHLAAMAVQGRRFVNGKTGFPRGERYRKSIASFSCPYPANAV